MNLPWDILSDILIRLPLKSIARFRCVNHSWDNQLKCPKFLKARNQYAVEMGKFNLMFRNQNDIHTFSYDTSLSTCERTSHIQYPDESNEKEIEVLGCCNGLVLLRHIDSSNDASLSCVIILWNPTTNECKRLPNPPTGKKMKDRNYVEYGLGYDEQIEDFKVVHLTQAFYSRWAVCEVYVYTLKENSWRGVDSIPIDGLVYPRLTDMGRWPVNGGFHWMAQLERSNFLHGIFLLRFVFETEDYDVVSLPAFDEKAIICLCVLGGSLCCFCYGTEVADVWELKYNGEEEESWTKLFTVELREHFGKVSSFVPLKFLNNGKIVLGVDLADGCFHIAVYDPKHVTFETIKVHDESLSSDAFGTSFYEESLFSLGTGTYLGKVHWEASDEEDWIDSSEEDDDSDSACGGDGKEE